MICQARSESGAILYPPINFLYNGQRRARLQSFAKLGAHVHIFACAVLCDRGPHLGELEFENCAQEDKPHAWIDIGDKVPRVMNWKRKSLGGIDSDVANEQKESNRRMVDGIWTREPCSLKKVIKGSNVNRSHHPDPLGIVPFKFPARGEVQILQLGEPCLTLE